MGQNDGRRLERHRHGAPVTEEKQQVAQADAPVTSLPVFVHLGADRCVEGI